MSSKAVSTRAAARISTIRDIISEIFSLAACPVIIAYLLDDYVTRFFPFRKNIFIAIK